jgi:hypothetical protein
MPEGSTLPAREDPRAHGAVAAPPDRRTGRAGRIEEPAGGISVTFVGHSTVLVRMDGVSLLTDPVYSSR